MSKAYPLLVKEVNRETSDSVSITFEVPESLRGIFRFIPGQYLTLRKVIGGEEVRRAYSLCSAPYENKWQVAVKRVPNGKFSVFANDILKAGDTLEVFPPEGKFTPTIYEDAAYISYLAFVAGSGITPVMSILKHLLYTSDKARFTLFYGNKTAEDILFKDELANLKNRYLDRLSIYHIFSREEPASPLFFGRIGGDKVKTYAEKLFQPSDVTEYFACGPGEMVMDVVDTLRELGVEASRLKYELFTPAKAKDSPSDQKGEADQVDTSSHDKVKLLVELDGDDFSLEADPRLTILDTGLMNDLDLPYACKAGICCTCKAKLLEGEVKMERADSLDQDEIDAGYILTCQAFPKSDTVKVDFDI